MEIPKTEHHPFEPFLPDNTQVLMLGSFPPQPKRWAMDFYYPNYTNDMWRIMGIIFYDNKFHFLDVERKGFHLDKITDFLNEKGIAFFDTATSIRRLQDNASDKFLEVVSATDVKGMIRNLKDCKAIVTTGEKATETLCEQFSLPQPKVGDFVEFTFEERPLRLYRMPSSSRAYPVAVEKKASTYRILFEDLQMI